MSFEIKRGLFGFDFTDYHAVIGVSVDANLKEIRKQYLSIARRLHPDVCRLENKDRAQELLSKLINPAYAKLSNERDFVDYGVLLRMTGKRLVEESNQIHVESVDARALLELQSLDQVRKDYTHKLSELAKDHYTDLSRSIEQIAVLSELNQVYLLRRTQNDGGWGRPVEKTSNKVSATGMPIPAPPPPPKTSQESLIDSYYHRAESRLEQNNFPSARTELQDALKLEPGSARCHALIAKTYLLQNEHKPASVNVTMAKSHLAKAVKADAHDPVVLEVRRLYNKMSARPTSGKPTSKKPAKKTDKGGGGLFGGLFGGKKS
jgi:curved DNA-binding protein CbpA